MKEATIAGTLPSNLAVKGFWNDHVAIRFCAGRVANGWLPHLARAQLLRRIAALNVKHSTFGNVGRFQVCKDSVGRRSVASLENLILGL